jgi:hypothetical protein
MLHPDVEDRNTGILSVVPDAPEEPESPTALETIAPETQVPKATYLASPMKDQRLFRGIGLAFAFMGIAFLVNDYLAAKGSLRPLSAHDAGELSSFVKEASLSATKPRVLFAQVDESWELLSEERRREEAESLFATAKERWGARDGFLHRGDAIVAQHWDDKLTVFGSLHGVDK